MSGSNSGFRSLPQHPHMGVLRKLAKAKLASLRKQDPSARLCQAQRVVAKEYGMPSWRKLRAQVESQRAAGGESKTPAPATVLRVTLVSTPLVAGDKATNLASMADILRCARKADVFVFPELNIAGGFWRDGQRVYRQMAEVIPDGPSCRAVIELARQHGTHICAGLLESAPGGCYVTHVLCGPEGFIGRQRKLFANNARSGLRFVAGDEPVHVFEVCGHRVCILASADWLFPEAVVAAAMVDAALVLCPCDEFAVKSQRNLDRLIRSRAMDLHAHVVAAFGHTPETQGEVLASMVADASGRLRASRRRSAKETRLTSVRLRLTLPDRSWGHPRDRMEIISPLLR